jgi:beta-lactamase class A
MLSRRAALIGGTTLAGCSSGKQPGLEWHPPPPPFVADPTTEAINAIETRVGGRVGVAALNVNTGQISAHRADERFAMCSSFKWLLAAAALELFPHDRVLRYGEADLIFHSPVTRAHVSEGAMSVEALCEATVVTSDNAAANVLLREMGGPEAFTRYLRTQGDAVTQLDRTELALNENAPGDPRDTTTPEQAVASLRHFLVDGAYNPANRAKLIFWMVACQTGLSRLRAGLPLDWRAGDKTGTSDDVHNATIDVAIAWPPGRAPILIACFFSDSTVDLPARNAAHAEIARIVVETWG